VEAALSGKTILTTRTAAQSGELATLLAQLGARVLECPAIELEPVENPAAIDDAISRLSSYHWLLFTSANAVDHFMKRARENATTIPKIEIAVVGSATAEKLKQWNLTPALTPERFNAEGLLESFPPDLTGVRILFPRAEMAREILPDELRHRGAIVDVLPVYRTKKAPKGSLDIARILQTETVDCVVFTSASAVQVMAESLGDQLQPALRNVPIAVIGPVTASSCEALGLHASIQPSKATIPDLVVAIRDFFNPRR
jgi:uroporphyrinogen III methyltransferase/synthase